MSRPLGEILTEARACRLCAPRLPHEPRPVVVADPRAPILIIGQAPGRRVHESGIPWDDPSGDRLRDWLGVDRSTFHDPRRFSIVPMGLCYPGTGRSGDLPPRLECAPTWHEPIISRLPRVELTLLLSAHAIRHYLAHRAEGPVAATVARWREYLPTLLPLPHPSPRNRRWLRQHPWFEAEVVPALRARIQELIRGRDRPPPPSSSCTLGP